MEILLMCLLGTALTWGVIDAVRTDDDDDRAPDSEPEPEPGSRDLWEAEDDMLLRAGSGDDTITGSANNATLYGGAGDDEVIVTGSGTAVHGESGNDTLQASGGNNTLFGGLGHDSLTADAGTSIYGGFGHDSITSAEFYSSSGRDGIFGDGGNDSITLANASYASVDGGDGHDRIEIALADNTVVQAGDGDDTIIAHERIRSVLYGGDGDDVFEVDMRDSYFEANYLFGGAGDDLFRLAVESKTDFGYSLPPTVDGDEGADQFQVSFAARNTLRDPDDTSPDGPYTQSLEISGFTPGEDQLLIDPYAQGSDANMTFLGLDLRPTQGGGTDILLRYAVNDQAFGLREQVDVIAVDGLVTAADVVIGALPAAAAA